MNKFSLACLLILNIYLYVNSPKVKYLTSHTEKCIEVVRCDDRRDFVN